eukprot:363626-Chlamydomonas_euryale.AAC.12
MQASQCGTPGAMQANEVEVEAHCQCQGVCVLPVSGRTASVRACALPCGARVGDGAEQNEGVAWIQLDTGTTPQRHH